MPVCGDLFCACSNAIFAPANENKLRCPSVPKHHRTERRAPERSKGPSRLRTRGAILRKLSRKLLYLADALLHRLGSFIRDGFARGGGLVGGLLHFIYCLPRGAL